MESGDGKRSDRDTLRAECPQRSSTHDREAANTDYTHIYTGREVSDHTKSKQTTEQPTGNSETLEHSNVHERESVHKDKGSRDAHEVADETAKFTPRKHTRARSDPTRRNRTQGSQETGGCVIALPS